MTEQLSTTMLKENICYTGNSNDKQFPGEISKHVDANDIEELLALVAQIEQDKDATLTSEASLKFCRVIARCRVFIGKFPHCKFMDTIYSFYKYCETTNSGWNHGKLAKLLDGGPSNVKLFLSHSPFSIWQIFKASLATNE